MTKIRKELAEITQGWAFIDGLAAITEYIERSALWVKNNGGIENLSEEERKLIEMMIDKQLEYAFYDMHKADF